MKTTVEEALVEAFAARAATLPMAAAHRIRSVDYHPRRHRRAVGVGMGAGAVAGAATAGTVLAVVLGGAAPAYGGWSATPASSSGSAPPATATETSCTNQLASMRTPTGETSPGTWQSVLTDVRGPFTVALFQAGNDYAACFTGPSFIEVNRLTSSAGTGAAMSGELSVTNEAGGSARGGSAPMSGQTAVVLEGTSSGDVNQVVQSNLTTTSDGPYTLIDGRVANEVTGVTLALGDGKDVVATVADGWFVAWWPGVSTGATSALVTKASGTTTESLVPFNKLAPPGSCTNASGTTHCASSGGGQVQTGNSGSSGSGQNVTRAGNSGGTGGTGAGLTKP
jgi:hypothetical protein